MTLCCHRGWTWLDNSNPVKQAAFIQLVAHVMLRRRVTRAGEVPGTKLRWQELEDVGMAYLTQPGAF